MWSDARVIELSKKFVPSTDEVFRLQSGSDPECVFFQQMANHGHYGGRTGTTRQGVYVCAPSGKFLASVNSNDPERVLETMREGLSAWEETPASERRLAAASAIQPQHRWEDSFPADGLVLNIIVRDLPEKCDPLAEREVKWNQDNVWFSREEGRQWLGADPQPGDVHQVPEKLVRRLARFHLVDNVKGQTEVFSRTGVEGSSIATEVVARTGPEVRLRVSGSTRGVAPEGWWQSGNGVVTRVLGQATFDLEKGTFTAFDMLALGRRWGFTPLNGRGRDPESSGPLGYVFRLAPSHAPRIPPARIDRYDVSWVVPPARP